MPDYTPVAAGALPSWTQYDAAKGTAEADAAICIHPSMLMLMTDQTDSVHMACPRYIIGVSSMTAQQLTLDARAFQVLP